MKNLKKYLDNPLYFIPIIGIIYMFIMAKYHKKHLMEPIVTKSLYGFIIGLINAIVVTMLLLFGI